MHSIPHPSSAIWGYIIGFLCLWVVYYLFKIITGKEGMGYGDFKLLAALGAWMGPLLLPLIVLLSSLVGAIIGIILLKSPQGKSAFCFWSLYCDCRLDCFSLG